MPQTTKESMFPAGVDSNPNDIQRWSRNLISAEDQRILQVRSNTQGLIQTVGNLGLVAIFSFISLYNPSQAIRIIARCTAAFFAAFLFNALHECVHNTAFKTKFVNQVVGEFCGFLMTRPLHHYTYYHYAHHKYTGDTQRDPELQYSFIDPKVDSIPSYLFYLSGLNFWIDRFTTLIRHGVLKLYLARETYILPGVHQDKVTFEARCFLAGYCLIGAAAYYNPALREIIVWGWIAVFAIGAPVLNFFLIAEHTGCTQNEHMLKNTRTTTTIWIYRRLAWNMSYHAEHHIFPYVPFFQLGNLNKKLTALGEKPSGCIPSGDSGYLAFHFALIKGFLKSNTKNS